MIQARLDGRCDLAIQLSRTLHGFLLQVLGCRDPLRQRHDGHLTSAQRQVDFAAFCDLSGSGQRLGKILEPSFHFLRTQKTGVGWCEGFIGQTAYNFIQTDGCQGTLQAGLLGCQIINGMDGHSGQRKFACQV